MHYVLSDIHGSERRFDSILERINPRWSDTLYVLGDVIDRNPDGIRLLRRLMRMSNVQMVLGNHEYMMLRALGYPVDSNRDDGRALEHWYRNGGGVTHSEWVRLRERECWDIVDYLHSLPLQIDVDVGNQQYILVHGAPVECRNRYRGSEHPTDTHFAVWYRIGIGETLLRDRTIIFGHTPTHHFQEGMPMKIWHGEGRICIDCGSGWPESKSGGRLGCLRLEDGAEFYSE